MADTTTRGKVAHVHEGHTKYITLHRQDGERSVVNLEPAILDRLDELSAFSRDRQLVVNIMAEAIERLEADFANRINAVAQVPTLHDGCLIMRVKPSGGIFDQQLAYDLSQLAWQLEDRLREESGKKQPPVMLGFRQEFGD